MARDDFRRWLCACLIPCFVFAATSVHAVPVAFDMGTEDSALEEGFVRVTADQAYSAEAGFGWVSGLYRSFDTSPPKENINPTAMVGSSHCASRSR